MSITDAEFSALLKRLSELERRLLSAQEQIDGGAVGISSVDTDSTLSGDGTNLSALSAAPLSGTLNARFVDLSGSVTGRFNALSGTIDSRVVSVSSSIVARVDDVSGSVTGRFVDLSGTINSRFASFSGIDITALSGSVDRHFATNGNSFLNAASFGMTAGAGFDNRLILQTAINEATRTGLPLFIPSGTYYFSRHNNNPWSVRVQNSSSFTLFGVPGETVLSILPTTSSFTQLSVLWVQDSTDLTIRDIDIDGNWGHYIAQVVATATLPASTISVNSTTGFSSSGRAYLQNAAGYSLTMDYTGKTSTTFTGCTFNGGGIIPLGTHIGTVNSQYGINHWTQAAWTGSVATGSNGQAINSLTDGLLWVNNLSQVPGLAFSFVNDGRLSIQTDRGWQKVDFTGKISGSTYAAFTGVTAADGGSGTISTGNPIYYSADPKSHGISVYINTRNMLIENVRIRNIYGDGIRIGSGLLIPTTKDITVRKVNIDNCARNGITVSSRAENVLIDDVQIDNVYTTAIDCEPETDGAWVRKVTVRNCTLGSLANRGAWWLDHGSTAENAFSIGGSSSTHPQPNNYIQQIRVVDNKIFGSVSITDGYDVVLRGNSIYQLNRVAWSPIYITIYANDIWIDQNWIYDMAETGSFTKGAISVVRSVTCPLHIKITNNSIHPKNGKSGIYIEGPGGPSGLTGTAMFVSESITSPTNIPGFMKVEGVSWTTSLYNGAQIIMNHSSYGPLLNTVAATTVSNDTGTLQFGVASNWTDAFGNEYPAPDLMPFTIYTSAGVTEVEGNCVDCRNDGNGNGTNGVHIQAPQVPNSRYRISRNTIRSASGSAITVTNPGVTTNAFRMTEIVDNHIWDDLVIPQTNFGISFASTGNLGRFVMRGNIIEPSIPTAYSGVISGMTWLEEDGVIQRWAGYGLPTMSASNGSEYRNLTPTSVETVKYYRVTGSWHPARGY